MSAGQSARRGYAIAPRTTTPTSSTTHFDDAFSVIVAATLIFVLAAVLSDNVLSAALGHILGTAWSSVVTLANTLIQR
jgi:hypothetical protein